VRAGTDEEWKSHGRVRCERLFTTASIVFTPGGLNPQNGPTATLGRTPPPGYGRLREPVEDLLGQPSALLPSYMPLARAYRV
jgi:hypothetical protein